MPLHWNPDSTGSFFVVIRNRWRDTVLRTVLATSREEVMRLVQAAEAADFAADVRELDDMEKTMRWLRSLTGNVDDDTT